MSFWERHKHNIYKYGHIYATLYGLMVINYIPQRPTNTYTHRLAVIYGHALSVCLILVLPIYFARNISVLTEAGDQRGHLLLLVNFANTLLKYITVVVTYVANFAHYAAIRAVTRVRQQLEDDFNGSLSALPAYDERPRKQFEAMLLFKFGLINAMMAVQVANILYQHFNGAHPVRVHIAVYTFVLWNYTENMADYFYFINSSALKFYQQLNQQLRQVLHENKLLHYFRLRGQRRGTVLHLCGLLCDRLDTLAERYRQINKLYQDSLTMHQFQILGLVFITLISNLTNSFILFNLFVKHSESGVSPAIVLNTAHAIIFYVDTYIVALVSENINLELRNINQTLREFSQLAMLDARLQQTVEGFALYVMNNRVEVPICGLFMLDRSLTFVTASTALSYFITLVQFDMNLT
ncbi:PREDICTED: gustatory receptor 10a [Bactrocera latifrons]|uniref:gustatory receptor 10a n=1 Tax=Bactrocera latifrons TaxID=174628 RepID=UPI0008DE785E|nr:PREDICTED: gustatory receptor 10a [Bactrocera latifrons]